MIEGTATTAETNGKAALRRQALMRRDGLAPDQRIEASLRIAEHGARELAFSPGTTVSGFMPIRSEPDTRPLMAALADRGARLALPVVVDRETIVFRELVRGAPLVATGFGTVGPGPDAAVLHPELLLLPLAAFDPAGNRIGYGAGHYDRAVARLIGDGFAPRLVGVAFDVQEVEAVPFEDHDRPLDAVLTESGLRSFANEGAGRHLLFVFGTLKKGFPLHESGLAGATFLGKARTAQSYPMRVAGPWFAPMMFDRPGTGVHVRGELYEVDDDCLDRLDAMESLGKPGNFRIALTVERAGSGQTCEALAYVKSPDLAVPTHTGYLEEYEDRRFVPPWLRKEGDA